MRKPKLLIALSGLVFPGLGHVLLGRRARGLVFFVVLSSLFFGGVFLEREFYTKFGHGLLRSKEEVVPYRSSGEDLEGVVDKTWKVIFVYAYPFFVGFGNYCIGLVFSDATAPLVAHIPGVQKATEIPVTTRDIGYCFALLAGLLNLLVMMDSFDIAANEEELARRKQS
ncbi:MAG: hypothetical protein HY815_18820 [Candidatus Riflebacteria bacterium]|nr:hypothetical protein [Candidatus Riflebacteria bacterium]